MLVFKQSVSKEEIWLQVSYVCCGQIFVLMGLLYSAIRGDNMAGVGLFFVFIICPFLLVQTGFALGCLEWFRVYEDRIEARTIYGIKNKVYMGAVQFVEESQINLTVKGISRTFYIFHDGRKSAKDFLGITNHIQSCYNKKKYNFRMRKTQELEDYIKNTLHLEIRNTEMQCGMHSK